MYNKQNRPRKGKFNVFIIAVAIIAGIIAGDVISLELAGSNAAGGLRQRFAASRCSGAGQDTPALPSEIPPGAAMPKMGREPARAGSLPPANRDWLDELIEKIHQVEASGRLNPPDGDGGKSAGPLQLHECVVDDVNRYRGTDFAYEDRRDPEKARRIAKLYITMWLQIHRDEIAARIFNGGPRGWRKKSTDGYWNEIQAQSND
ncbi:MAG TPA: hypothetical protein HPP51_03120 [Planctomycetes bacterium]|nr:hypothetical protein [Planctomycetota bacterium]